MMKVDYSFRDSWRLERLVSSKYGILFNIKYTIRSIVCEECEASCHTVSWSLDDSVNKSLGHLVTWSVGHSMTRSISHLGTWSISYLVTRSLGWSLGHSVTWSLIRSLGHSVTRSIGHSVSRSLGHSVTRSLGHSVNRSLGHLVNWSFGHAVTQSLGHSVTQVTWVTPFSTLPCMHARTNNIRIYMLRRQYYWELNIFLNLANNHNSSSSSKIKLVVLIPSSANFIVHSFCNFWTINILQVVMLLINHGRPRL